MTRLGSLCSPLAPLPPFSYAQNVPCGYRCCPASRCCPVSQLYEVSRCRCVVLASRWSRGHTPVRAWSSLGAMMVVVVVVVTVCIVYLTVNKHKYCRKTKEREINTTGTRNRRPAAASASRLSSLIRCRCRLVDASSSGHVEVSSLLLSTHWVIWWR
jgi:hypothetical protein